MHIVGGRAAPRSRSFVTSLAIAVALLLAIQSGTAASGYITARSGPSAGSTVAGLTSRLAGGLTGIHKIRHVVVIMQENRSFDSYFGTYPGANGIPMHNGVPTVCSPDPGHRQVRQTLP